MTTEMNQTDSLYPMRVVTRLTGLSAHTIRVWERRYEAVTPVRTSGNSRRYTASDVRRLMQLRQATGLGYKIKDLSELPDDELERLVEDEQDVKESAGGGESRSTVEQLHRDYYDAIDRFDARTAAGLLARAATLMEPTVFIFEVVLPILQDTGRRWEAGEFTVAHEHLITHQVRGLLDTILRLTSPQAGAPRLLIATPEGMRHEFGALVGTLLAAARGFEPVYLGVEVPVEDLVKAVEKGHFDVVLLGLLYEADAKDLRSLDSALGKLAKTTELWVGLPPDHPSNGKVRGVRYFERFEDLDIALTQRVSSSG